MAAFIAPRPAFAKPKGKSPLRPRNPLVAPALFRHAGSHGNSGHGHRQAAQRALKAELAGFDISIDDGSP